MPIQEGNIKLRASQVMDDAPEGGGQATASVIADGASNAIFPDISELDRAYGRINLRKAFVSVDTQSTDGYYGANVIISDPPDDAHVACTLFTTKDGFDSRADAQSKLEAYVLSGPLSRMRTFGNQAAGQRAVLVYQRPEETLPEVGNVYCLSVEDANNVVSTQQFIRVTEVTHELRVFTDATGDFIRRVLTLRLSDPLRYSFPGSEPSRFTNDPSQTKVRQTQVADATEYFSTVRLANDVAIGALGARVNSIYTQLVPSSTSEVPVSLAQIASPHGYVAAGAQHSETIVVPTNGAARRTLRSILPGSLTITAGGHTATDDGFGNLSGSLVTAGYAASVDYENGVLTFTSAATGTGGATVSYTPAARPSQAAHTYAVDITLATRGLVFSEAMHPIPTPGTLEVSYMALGKWYVLRDAGEGTLEGDSATVGAGTIDYTNGAVVITLGALPDVDTSVLYSWGSPAHYQVVTGNTTNVSTSTRFVAQLPNTPVVGSVTVTWHEAGVEKTAGNGGTGGNLTGSGASGKVNLATGEVYVDFPNAVDSAAGVSVAYSYQTPTVPSAPAVVSGVEIPLTVSGAELHGTITPPPVSGSLNFALKFQGPAAIVGGGNQGVSYQTLDGLLKVHDSLGSLIVSAGQMIDTGVTVGETVIGTINYTTGEIVIDTTSAPTVSFQGYSGTSGPFEINWYEITWQWIPLTGSVFCYGALNDTVTVAYTTGAASNTNTDTLTVQGTDLRLRIDVTKASTNAIVPGSLMFTAAGKTFIDRNGTLYTDVSTTTGSGTEAGTVNYDTGEAVLASWVNGAAASPNVVACLTTYGKFNAIIAAFRTAGAPVRSGSLYVQVSDIHGNLLTAAADTNGAVVGDNVRGTVNARTGVVSLRFGEMVTAAGNEGAYWYRAQDVVGGQIFRPVQVMPDTLRYSTVVQTTMPLNADIIGLDPVRLPADGRVPVMRPGNIAVVHNTATTSPATASNGQTVNCGRVRLARVRVIGNDGATITTGYSADLDAGTVTFNDVTGYSQPVHIEHRIEDMVLLSDAQISGDLTFTRPITHAYDASTSYVSSALIIGDMRARVPVLFDQATWANSWANTVSGSNATASFNDVIAPIAVTNRGAITERWALRFTNTTAFDVIGEHVGVIATGNTATDCAPTNPATGAPYFTVPASGWGSGWSAGNALRFNTTGALFPVWIARTIQQGPSTAPDDSFTILIRGDVDRP